MMVAMIAVLVFCFSIIAFAIWLIWPRNNER